MYMLRLEARVLRPESALAALNIILNLSRGREPRPLGELLDLFAFEAARKIVDCFEHKYKSDMLLESV